MFLGFTSLGGAFVSGCPFRSVFSSVIRLIFEILQALSKRIPYGCFSSKRLRRLWIGTLTFLWVASDTAVAYATFRLGTWFSLFFFPAAIPVAYSAQQEVVHKYKISHLAAWVFLFVSLSMIFPFYFESPLFILLFILECWVSSSPVGWLVKRPNLWLIRRHSFVIDNDTSSISFKKAGQMTGFDSVDRHYRLRLLESLMPLLTLLITSYHALEHHSSDTHSHSSKSRRNFKIYLKRKQSDDVLNCRYGLPTSLSLVDDDMVPTDKDPHFWKSRNIYSMSGAIVWIHGF